ncbi:NUDIX domain-containing protein [Streptomyces sp. NRRL B-1347]|uniref:NUDIX domain-containing protein n=1 Tax=Streptomyces sp. NRRL B-1347 TaxID=1476877 RepID=UPI00068AF091|nr:NUDIX domain-containing protein [Streptomyces sp. NRRL B-1347]
MTPTTTPYTCVVQVLVLLYRQDGRVLLLRRAEPSYRGQLTLVGGHLEDGEWYDQAACREVREEVGVRVDPKHLELACTAHLQTPDGQRRLALLLMTQSWSGEPRNCEPLRHTALVWADPGEPPAQAHPFTRALLRQFVTGAPRANISLAKEGWT